MKLVCATSVVLLVISAAWGQLEECDPSICTGRDCRCSSTQSPLALEDTPQFVVLSFDDSVQDFLFLNHYVLILFPRRNPDNNSISVSFYVPHEYSDYERVNELYNQGFDIGVNSITRESSTDYWLGADVATLVEEFLGQRQLISHFANIPIDDMLGARTPALALNGDNSFQAYVDSGIKYDNSWTAQSWIPSFPFTLDFSSGIPCLIGNCPENPFNGFWELPIINLQMQNGNECNSVLSCLVVGSSEEVSDWLFRQFNRHYAGNKAPLTLMINAAWFTINPNSTAGYIDFLDRLAHFDDVFLVSHREVLRWMQDPVPLSQYSTPSKPAAQSCVPRVCPLNHGLEIRYMKSCVACPQVYPWLGNPLGLA